MNVDILKGNWRELKGEAKKRWGKLTDDDLTQIEGEEEKFIGFLQKNYGYDREQAEREYRDFVSSHGRKTS